MNKFLFLIYIFITLSMEQFNLVFAQQSSIDPEQTENSSALNADKLNNIQIIKDSLTNLKKQLSLKQKMLDEATTPAQKLIEKAELENIQRRYDKTKFNLISVITDIKLEDAESDKPKENKKRDLLQEVQNLLAPMLDSFQRISAKPRRIQSIKNRIAAHEEQIQQLDQAVKNLDVVKNAPDFQLILADIGSYINDAIDKISDKKQEHILKIEALDNRLAKLTKDKKSFWQSASEAIQEFLSTRGKNLLLSFLVFFLVFYPMLKFREKVLLKFLAKHPDEWYAKPVNAFYGLVSIVFSFTMALLTLSALGDWVLVTLTILAVTGILWASKNYLPKYLTEFKLIMNFGTIKEGELVVYGGLPWKVKSIAFQTIFENDFLDSKQIRIQISEIVKLHSRKILPKEQWFPSRTGDWVLLKDGIYGQVVSQTLEQVVLELGGASRKYYLTGEYLQQCPINMSKGFIVEQTWTFDYGHQSEIINSIVPKIKALLEQKFKAHETPPTEVYVAFATANASSLNIYAMARFEGKFAHKRAWLSRDLNSYLLEITTQEKWIIPFNQLVVHHSPRSLT